MKKAIVITDVTRMHEGRVCIAGYDDGLSCLRPVLRPPGIHECALYGNGRPLVFPSAEVEFDFGQAVVHPPHTEDRYFMPGSIKFRGRLSEERWRALLTATQSAGLEAIFEQPIVHDRGYHVRDGQGARSLGTVQPAHLAHVGHRERQAGKWEYRLEFVDRTNARFDLPITDLAWRTFVDRQRMKGHPPRVLAAELTELLQQRAVFLRIGLARGWVEHPGACYVQITGIHTFPDYLIGLTWADYAPGNTRAFPV